MKESRRNIIIALVSLFISAIIQAAILCSFRYGWIMIIFVIVYAYIFLKYLVNNEIYTKLIEKYSKRTLRIAGIVGVFVGLSLMPQSFTQYFNSYLSGALEFVAYVFSYLFYMFGVLLLDAAYRR